MDEHEREHGGGDFDEERERDSEPRRDTEVRGSLGHSPEREEPDAAKPRDEGIPELDDETGDLDDRMSDR